MQLTKDQRFGIICTIIFSIVFTILLLIFGFSSEVPKEEDGILINFGTNEVGSGNIEPRPTPEPTPQESIPEPTSTPEPTSPTETTEEDVMNQDYEKTAAIEAQKRKEKEQQEEVERKKQKEIERQRQEELEQKRLAEEKRKREDAERKEIENLTKNAFGGKNPNGDDTGEGENGGIGNQGKPEGDINSKNREGGAGGNGTFSLTGRKSLALPKPVYETQDEGKVVVEVKVDQNGNVVSARAGVQGTTTSNKQLHNSAYNAAMKAKFDVNKNAPAMQVGTITYLFVLQ